MVPSRVIVLLVLLIQLVAAVPAQQLSAADQLSQLLGPIVESAVARALSGWQPALLTDLGRLQARLEMLERQLEKVRDTSPPTCGTCQRLTLATLCQSPGAETETGVAEGAGTESGPDPRSEPATEPPPEPVCERAPTPLPQDAAPHQEPTVRACARSCLQLRDQGGAPQDGVYWFTGMPVPVLCDFSHDGGGWTLLLTAVSHPGWDALSALSRSPLSPSLTDNYSILEHADAIRDLGTGSRFAYRIEAQAKTGRRRWGGVWLAPRGYSFVHETPSQTEVSLVRMFDNWDYKNEGIEKRMPWLNTGGIKHAVLTTSENPQAYWWGTLVTHEATTGYHHSPWIQPEAAQSGVVRYWVREEAF